MEHFKQKFLQFSEEIGQVDNVLKNAETRNKICAKELEECTNKLEECKKKMDEKEKQLQDLQKSYASLEQQCDEQMNAMTERNALIQSQIGQIAELEEKYGKLEAKGSFPIVFLFFFSTYCV